MAGLIPQSFIDDLLHRVNIVDVVDSRIKLKKAGKNHSACCPFHNEKTPSFTVSSDKQFYYCFGCGAKGNAVGFVMEYDNVDFPQAVEMLADSVGMEVPREEVSPQQAKKQEERTNLYELMGSANEFYQRQLRYHDAKQAAVDYLKNRGLSGKAAKFFNIGFAPPGWQNLQDSLANDDESLAAMVTAGLTIKNDQGRHYDRFRNRIIFPIRDVRGRTIGFGARTLGDDKPKYLNSPETPIFNKGQELYGLYECRQIRQPLKRFLIVEGYMDVVALHEFGIHYAVATLGTATSDTHLQKLFKIAPEIVFCFDGDEAGRRAAKRGLELVLPIIEDGQQIRFMFLPEGEDPDSLVRKEGKDGFELRMQDADGLSEFLLQTLKDDIDDPASLEGRARLAKLAAPLIKNIPGIALRSLFWQDLKEHTHIDVDELKQLAESEAKPELAPAPNPMVQSSAASHHHEHYESSYSSYDEEMGESREQPIQSTTSGSQEPRLIRQAIAILLHAPQALETFGDTGFLQEFQGPNTQLLQQMITALRQSPRQDLLGVLSLLNKEVDAEAYRQFKELAEYHNKQEGHLSQQQVAMDCLVQLRLKAAKNIKARMIKKAAQFGGMRQLPEQDMQLYQWAAAIVELDLLQAKLTKAGGKFETLTPQEQEKYRQLTGQS
ncbi:DNA primase [Bermanella marisrubri]|uniref:DNA primase n=1 Tax=Bermanella marisrubri TaxID=207949 RepID=Q1N3T7_9GAMM|nr:DNA primase [Bermanella marisrubri]EAT12787.1 DNA primase [Oceanobacter sp. RED65] [Bermanella marisrubri]QIZ83112.1 DNA primase [Bermanella marisrubri]